LDFRLLSYLVTTVDEGSANRAAAVLHISQPALSRQLRQLEGQLGLTLFQRQGRRLVLTRAGEQFVERARDLLAQADAVERTATSLASGRLTSMRLAAPTTTLTDVLAPFLATLRADDPVPTVRELDPDGALAALTGGADLAIVTRPPGRALASRPLAVLPIWAYVSAEDVWAGRGQVDLAELVERDLVLMTESFRPRGLLDAAVEEAGLSYGTVLECTNAQVAQALAAAGRGVAVVSDDARFGLRPLGVLGPRGPLWISLFAAWDPRHHAADVLAGIADRLAAFCVDRYGEEVSAGR